MITLKILWGESPEDYASPETYQFKTAAESDAFLRGAAACLGWQDYNVVDVEGIDPAEGTIDPAEYRGNDYGNDTEIADLTYTWADAILLLVDVIENPDFTQNAKEAARDELMEIAEHLDQQASQPGGLAAPAFERIDPNDLHAVVDYDAADDSKARDHTNTG